MTWVEGMEGFLAILQEIMWCANFSYQPEYFVYARSIGLGLDECVAKVVLRPQLIEGETEEPLKYQGMGSYPEAAIQDAAYQAMAGLRAWCLELQTSHTFAYFPQRIMGPINGIRYPNPMHLGTNRSQRQSELVRDLDWVCWCTH